MKFRTVLYEARDRVATITLNRPDRRNAINVTMPEEIAAAFAHAEQDDAVHAVVLTGAGKGFCAGYDVKEFAESVGENPVIQDMPWDPMIDYRFMSRCTHNFMSIWRCHKPVIAKLHGDAVAGGSDIALCCDIIVMNENARIGYPPSRVWGCPTTAMWVYRLGIEKAKQMLFTGDLISGRQAEAQGLVYKAVPLDVLDDSVDRLVSRIKGVPKNQLMMTKMLVNQVYENMGLSSSQTLATLFDGMARHGPEGVAFKQRVEDIGFKHAVAERDSGAPIPGSKR